MSPRLPLGVLLCVSTLHLQSSICNAFYPPKLTLRAGVLQAPPFAIREDDGTYSGFQPDLLERLKVFAAEDGVDLEFLLGDSPAQYGDALDLIANDCNTTDNPNSLEECLTFDLIVGDYYCNPDRSVRVDFTPAWLRTTMTTLEYVGKEGRRIDTMTQLEAAEATACVPEGTYLMNVVMREYPGASYYKCPSPIDCIEKLKADKCSLYVDDELLLRYRSLQDSSLELNRENFNTQYLVWPMSYRLDHNSSSLIKKWLYAAVANATLDELYYKYFEVKSCPVGTAGENCDEFCDPKHGESSRDGVCICESTKWTDPGCSVEVHEDLNMIPPALKAVGYVFYGINVAVALGCAAWLHRKRNTPQVRVAQPFFLKLVLLGCFISSSTILALAQEDAGEGPVPACVALPWLYSFGFCITFGTLFVKIRRVYKIFKGAAHMQRVAVTAKETLLQVGAILLVDVVIIAVWTGVDQLHWERTVLLMDKYGDPLSSQGYCTSEYWPVFISLIAVLHFSLLLVACYLCYVTRNIPTKFSEGQYLSLAILSNFQIFLIGVPVLVIVGIDSTSGFFVRCAIIFINDLAIMGLIFGNLMYSVWMHRGDISTRTAIKSYIDREVVSQACMRSSNDIVSSHKVHDHDASPHLHQATQTWASTYRAGPTHYDSQLSDHQNSSDDSHEKSKKEIESPSAEEHGEKLPEVARRRSSLVTFKCDDTLEDDLPQNGTGVSNKGKAPEPLEQVSDEYQ